MSTENRIFMVFSAFYLIMIRYRIANICLIVLHFVWIIAILVNNAFKTVQQDLTF